MHSQQGVANIIKWFLYILVNSLSKHVPKMLFEAGILRTLRRFLGKHAYSYQRKRFIDNQENTEATNVPNRSYSLI